MSKMWRFLPVLAALLLAGPALAQDDPAPGLSPPKNLSDLTSTSAARGNLRLPDGVLADMADPQWNLSSQAGTTNHLGDYNRLVGPVSYDSGSNIVGIGCYHSNIQIVGSTFTAWTKPNAIFRQVPTANGSGPKPDVGQPYHLIVPSGAGAGTYDGTITAVASIGTVTLSNVPAAGVASTDPASWFCWGPPTTTNIKISTQTIKIPGALTSTSQGNYNLMRTTATAILDNYRITVASNAGSTALARYMTVVAATDDSTAVNALLSAITNLTVTASTKPQNDCIQVNGDYYIPSVSALITEYCRIGNGTLHQDEDWIGGDTNVKYDLPVARSRAAPPLAQAASLGNQIIPGSMPELSYAAPITVEIIGHSLGVPVGTNNLSSFDTGAQSIIQAIKRQRSLAGLNFTDTIDSRAIGGTNLNQLCNSIQTSAADWTPNPALLWMGNDASGGNVHDLNPDMLISTGFANDGQAFDPKYLYCLAYGTGAGLINQAGALNWSHHTNLGFFIDWIWSEGAWNTTDSTPAESNEYWAGYLRGFAALHRLPVFDLADAHALAELGAPIESAPMRTRADVVAAYNGEYPMTPPYTSPFQVVDYSGEWAVSGSLEGGSIAAAFASWGGGLTFSIGHNRIDNCNQFTLGYNAGTGNLTYKIDGTCSINEVPTTDSSVNVAADTSTKFNLFFAASTVGRMPTCYAAIQTAAPVQGPIQTIYNGPCPRLRAPTTLRIGTLGGTSSTFAPLNQLPFSDTVAFVSNGPHLTEGYFLPALRSYAEAGYPSTYSTPFGYSPIAPWGSAAGGSHHMSTLLDKYVLDPVVQAQRFVDGLRPPAQRAITGSATLQTGDLDINLKPGGSSLTVTMPANPQKGVLYRFKNTDATLSPTVGATIAAGGCTTIDGGASVTFNEPRSAWSVEYYGADGCGVH